MFEEAFIFAVHDISLDSVDETVPLHAGFCAVCAAFDIVDVGDQAFSVELSIFLEVAGHVLVRFLANEVVGELILRYAKSEGFVLVVHDDFADHLVESLLTDVESLVVGKRAVHSLLILKVLFSFVGIVLISNLITVHHCHIGLSSLAGALEQVAQNES